MIDIVFFLMHLFAARDMACISQYGNVCEVASFGNFDWAEQTGSMVFVRAGVPFKSELVNHEECHVRQYESGKPLGEDECYTAMWS